MPQILCEELMCLQIASQRLHHRNGSRTSTCQQQETDSEFSPAFFTTQQSDGKGNHVKTASAGDSVNLNDAAPSRPAAEIHVAWNRVCKEVILASRFETVAERNDNLPLSVLDALPMSTKLVATKIARRLGIFTNTATAARFGGNVAAPTRRPKHAMYANLIEEFRTAWQHHQEAQSRARLKALKENDADAYMECLQHTKLTSLLHIMELTHSFMISIGAQLDKQQTAQQRPQVSSAHGQERPGHQTKNTTATTIAGDDYSRFKEYVASTKDEYKLVHKSAVYVEQQPVGLNATLMPHQLVGLRFLASLHANNINGILADEMGVGKTIQTIAFLLCLKEGGSGAPPFYGPHLVIAPLSIVREWSEACEQFVKGTMNCGELGEIIASGERLDTFDLVFLAAHRVRNVTAAINAVRWGYIVVDEAHKAVSNLKTMTAQAINAIPCKHRLVLTGTPLNSDLQELWSLLNFINPNIFKDLNSFDDVFRKPFQAIGAGDGHEGAQLNDEERALLVMRLHQVIRPFMLRRTKRDIDQTLQISYHEIHCPLTFPQEMLLRTLREEKQLPCVIEGRCVHRSVLTIEQSAQSLCNHAFMIPFLSQVLEKNRLHALALLPPPPQTSPPTVVDVGSKQKCDEKVSVANASSAQHLLMQEATDISRPSTGAAYDHQNSESAVAELDRTESASTEASDEGTTSSEKEVTTALPTAAASVVVPSHEALISIGCSGKLLVLDLILRRARAAGVKAVIFTHWLDCIDLLTEYFDGALGWQAGREYVALTGSSSSDERKECVEQFRHDPNCAVFLVSMKAGGCGLNLQVTHLIIMMDRDYTGTNEEQAIARVFRIGQRNIVRALYLLTKDPSEQRILDIAAKKDKPRHAIIEGGGYHVEAVTDEERREVLDKATGAGPADVIDLSSETLLNMCGPHILDSLIVPRCAISSEEDAQAPMTAAVEALMSLNKDGIRSGFFSQQSLPVVFQEALAECQAEKDNKDQLDDLGRGKRNRSHFNEDDIVPDWYWDKLAEEGIDDDEIEDRWKAKRHKERQLAQLSSVSFEASGVKLTEQSVSEEAGSRYRRMPCAGVLTNHR